MDCSVFLMESQFSMAQLKQIKLQFQPYKLRSLKRFLVVEKFSQTLRIGCMSLILR